jgi:hypothetical protein
VFEFDRAARIAPAALIDQIDFCLEDVREFEGRAKIGLLCSARADQLVHHRTPSTGELTVNQKVVQL